MGVNGDHEYRTERGGERQREKREDWCHVGAKWNVLSGVHEIVKILTPHMIYSTE